MGTDHLFEDYLLKRFAHELSFLLASPGTDVSLHACLCASTRWEVQSQKPPEVFLTTEDLHADSVVKQRPQMFPCICFRSKHRIIKVWQGKTYSAPCEYMSLRDVLGCWDKVAGYAPEDLPLIAASGQALDSDGSQSSKYRHMEGLLASYRLLGGSGAIFQRTS